MKTIVKHKWKHANLVILGNRIDWGSFKSSSTHLLLRSQPTENAKFKEEEEQLRKRFTEQVKAEESRFRKWEQQVKYQGGWVTMVIVH